jgi:hypothetical protein
MINCFLCPYPFLNSPCLFVNKTFNTYVFKIQNSNYLHMYHITLLDVLVMQMTLEINQLDLINFCNILLDICVPDYLLLPVHDAIVLPGEFKADALKDKLACFCSVTSCSILTLQGF